MFFCYTISVCSKREIKRPRRLKSERPRTAIPRPTEKLLLQRQQLARPMCRKFETVNLREVSF